jgi:hypothetical protein
MSKIRDRTLSFIPHPSALRGHVAIEKRRVCHSGERSEESHVFNALENTDSSANASE